MTLVLVLVGGALGAPLRYLTDLIVQSRHTSGFPWGTFAVNMIGSLILGVVLGAASGSALSSDVVALVGTGVCGALTTFSTFSFETVRLAEEGDLRDAALNVVLSLLVGLGAAAAGWALGLALV